LADELGFRFSGELVDIRARVSPKHRQLGSSLSIHSSRKTVRILNMIDEYTRECLAIHVCCRINNSHLIEVLADAAHPAG
jgi:hypothetical protein